MKDLKALFLELSERHAASRQSVLRAALEFLARQPIPLETIGDSGE